MLQPDLKEVTQTFKKLSNITYLRRSDGETLLFCTGLYGNISLLQLNGASGNNFVIVYRLCFLLHEALKKTENKEENISSSLTEGWRLNSHTVQYTHSAEKN